MKHSLNIPPHEFCRIADGTKTFVAADDETGFQFGDELELIEFDEDPITPTDKAPKGPTGEKLNFKIGFIQNHGSSRAVLSLLPAPKAAARKKG